MEQDAHLFLSYKKLSLIQPALILYVDIFLKKWNELLDKPRNFMQSIIQSDLNYQLTCLANLSSKDFISLLQADNIFFGSPFELNW